MRPTTGLAILLVLGVVPMAEALDVCGDADGNGSVTVSDGVQTLRAAADLSSTCTPARCDVDGSGAVTVSDGVDVLRLAADLLAPRLCPTVGDRLCTSAFVTVTLDVPEPIGAASLVLTYPRADVNLPGAGDAAASRVGVLGPTSLFGNGLPNDLDDRVVFSLVAPDGLGDGPLLAVDFDCIDVIPSAIQFRCTLSDVVAPDGVTAVDGATCTVGVVAQ